MSLLKSAGNQLPTTAAYPRVDIILVNWNGAADTLECLESVFRLHYPNYRVIVCDNASKDGSLERIEAWASVGVPVAPASQHFASLLNGPRLKEPFPFVRYARAAAESVTPGQKDPTLILIDTGGNLGFAGGNNVGLRYSLAQSDAKYMWLLNTDTVVHPEALTHLVDSAKRSDSIGSVGSLLVYYWNPKIVQAMGGGTFDLKTTTVKHIGVATHVEQSPLSLEQIETSTSYIVGASMLVTRPLLEEVGLMCEDYFLYFEELDWAFRAKNKFRLGFSPQSIVYHKVGGSSSKIQSVGALRFLYRNKLKFIARHIPSRYPLALFAVAWEMTRHLLMGRFTQANLSLKTLLSARLLWQLGRGGAGHHWK